MQYSRNKIKLSTFPHDFFKENKAELNKIRQNVSILFSEVGTFLIQTLKGFNDFQDSVMPKINYYFSLEESRKDNFIETVLLPGKRKMDEALNEASLLIHGDKETYSEIESSINETLNLKSCIDSIIELVDDIEIYFLNTMIISVKSGSEGHALTKLSDEMGKLSGFISEISYEFNQIIEKLNFEYDEFISSKGELDRITVGYFSGMKDRLDAAIASLLDTVPVVASEISKQFIEVDYVQEAINEVISKVQMDDLFRQDIEKVIYFIENFVINFNLLEDHGLKIDEDRMGIITSYIINFKVKTFENTLEYLSSESKEYIKKIFDISKKLVKHFKESEKDKEQNFEKAYDMVYETHQDIIGSINEIIKGKNEIYIKSDSILKIINKLEDFFKAIEQITKKFETVNVLTRIEVARSSVLGKLIGGTLSQISILPEKIKAETDTAIKLYSGIKNNLKRSVEQYYNIYVHQKDSIESCTETIETIAAQLFESKAHYERVQDEVVNYSKEFLEFLSSKEHELNKLEKTKEEISLIAEELREYFPEIHEEPESFIKNYSTELKMMHDYIDGIRSEGDYSMMIILSLLSEFIEKQKGEDLTFF